MDYLAQIPMGWRRRGKRKRKEKALKLISSSSWPIDFRVRAASANFRYCSFHKFPANFPNRDSVGQVCSYTHIRRIPQTSAAAPFKSDNWLFKFPLNSMKTWPFEFPTPRGSIMNLSDKIVVAKTRRQRQNRISYVFLGIYSSVL